MSVVTARTLGKAIAKRAVRRLPRVNRVVKALPGTLVRIETGPFRRRRGRNAGSMGRHFAQAFNSALKDLPTTNVRYAGAIADKRVSKSAKHYFTREGWQKFGRTAYLKMRDLGFRPKITRKRGGGYPIDAYQALAGLGAAAIGLGARRRRRARRRL